MRFAIAFLMTFLVVAPVSAADWAAFRGPGGNGISDAVNVPVTWDSRTNVKWKVPLPGNSNGSPIISRGAVFLTSAQDEGRKRHLHCFAADDGSQRWVRTVEFGKVMPTHKTNLYGGSTPAANGDRVVVWHGSAGLYCYDFAGNELWKRDLGEFRHQWGYGTSPVIHDDKVILHSGPGAQVFVAAFHLQDGTTIWKTDEPVEGDGEYNNQKKYMGSWSTPVVVTVEQQTLIVCSMATRVNAYDPQTGNIVWTCEGLRGPKGDLCYTSPVVAGDLCVVMGGFNGPAIGFRMQGNGDITASQRLWRHEKGTPQRIGSGVVVDGAVFMANAGVNTLECIDPESGERFWRVRSEGAAHWGSLILADGRIYGTDQQGTTHVFRPSTSGYEPLASNPLGEPGNATPAVADGQIFIRTFAHLYCIAQ